MYLFLRFVIFFILLKKIEFRNMNREQSMKERANLFAEFKAYYEKSVVPLHLRDLLKDQSRNTSLMLNFKDELLLDFSHEKLTENVMEYFQKVIETVQLNKSISEMLNGEMINTSMK